MFILVFQNIVCICKSDRWFFMCKQIKIKYSVSSLNTPKKLPYFQFLGILAFQNCQNYHFAQFLKTKIVILVNVRNSKLSKIAEIDLPLGLFISKALYFRKNRNSPMSSMICAVFEMYFTEILQW